jgi:peptidoglycan/LPS O-acetylase OafA/YrhL
MSLDRVLDRPGIAAGPSDTGSTRSEPLRLPVGAGEQLPELEGLRGLAILLVMLHHFTIYGGMQPAVGVDRVYYQLARAGWCGVDLFFVLSGFLITGILLDAKGGTSYFRNFYLRRALRIFPLYYGVLIAIFWVLPNVMLPPPTLREEVAAQGWYWTYLLNVRTAQTGWPHLLGLGHFWSLAVEEQFYLLWPAVVFLLDRRRLLRLCLALIVVSLFLRVGLVLAHTRLAAYVLMPARMDALAIGGMLAAAARDATAWAVVRRWTPAAGMAALWALAFLFLRWGRFDVESVQVQTIGFTIVAVLSGTLLVAAIAGASGGPARRVFGGRFFRFFGHYSYGLYVFHHLFVFLLAGYVLSVDRLPRLFESQLPGQILFLLLATGASVTLALVSWYCWEQPFLRLKRFFPYRRS